MPRPRSWTDEQLAAAVAASRTLSEVHRRLGLRAGKYDVMRAHIVRLGLDASHLPCASPTSPRKRLSWRDEDLARAVAENASISWAKGKDLRGRRILPLDEILVENSAYRANSRLRKRLIAAGLKPAHCEECGLAAWRGQGLPLALDHVNGDHTDNRLANLRILCPNCHALTETWCRRRPA